MTYKLKQEPAHSSNYSVGRFGRSISEIVIHHAATTSFNGIAATFANPARNASAHYGVKAGHVDQYVDESNYAWHCGNFEHNARSIGIENVNSSGAPNWGVSNGTFDTLVELCADIVKRNPGIGQLKHGKNLFGHKEVGDNPTFCPGVLMDRMDELADRVNAIVSGKSSEPAKTSTPTTTVKKTSTSKTSANPRKSNAVVANEVLAGAWGNNPHRKRNLIAAGYNYAEIQNAVNKILAGDKKEEAPKREYSNEDIAEQVIAGAWGNGADRRINLKREGYDYDKIQPIVNKLLGVNVKGAKSAATVANEVLVGKWGNGADRKSRLEKAGYDFKEVQAIVNKKLGY